jgi:nucleoid DNA-binding protein
MKPAFNITLYPQSFQTVLNMSNNLTKRHIVQKIYENADSSHREVSKIVQETLECITEALSSGMNVELRNFGVFELQVRKSRVGRNPNLAVSWSSSRQARK